MNLHEYQGKEIFAKYDLPVSKGKVVRSVSEVKQACNEIGGNRWVAKAQVHAGGTRAADGHAAPASAPARRALEPDRHRHDRPPDPARLRRDHRKSNRRFPAWSPPAREVG